LPVLGRNKKQLGCENIPKKSSMDDLSHLGGFGIVPAPLRPDPYHFFLCNLSVLGVLFSR